MKFPSHRQPKRKKRSRHVQSNASEPAGLVKSAAIACGTGLACGTAATLIFSLLALLCGFGGGIISALGYFTAALTFAVCGFVAGKRGRAAIPSGVLAACGMTLISVMLAFLPFFSPSELSAVAYVAVRLGLAAIAVIFAVIGSNK